MEFLNPVALFGLLALPLLLIPYLIKRKPRRMVFSSLLLFLEGGAEASRPLGKINLPPIFFLQLLLLALLVFAVSEPVFSIRPTSIAVVIDNSASMQALQDGKSRLALAQERAGAVIGELGSAGQVDLYVTTPRLTKIHPAPLTAGAAKSALKGLKSHDLGDPPIDYDQALRQLVHEQNYQRLYLITDHPSSGQSAAIRVLSVGRPQENLAVTTFDVRRSSLTDARMEASATVANFSGRDEKVRISLKANGAVLASRELSVSADKTANATFQGFPEHPSYEVEIAARDALALDNRRFATAPGARNLRILAITPRPQAASSLKAIQGVSVDVIAPADYGNFQSADYGLEIFHFATPARLPENPALFILPPENNSLVDLGAPTSNRQISSWREPHMLTRYINFSLLRPTYARPLTPQTAGDVIIESPAGALAFAVQRPGMRYLILGFDPLPYLGRENLPMSIFTLNLLDWFFESSASRGQATGSAIPLLAPQTGDFLITPVGEKIALKPGLGVFSSTFAQGIYRHSRARGSELYARNFDDVGESDLRASSAIELRSATPGSASPSVLFSFWPYLLLASLILLIVEWFIHPRLGPPSILARGRRPLGVRR